MKDIVKLGTVIFVKEYVMSDQWKSTGFGMHRQRKGRYRCGYDFESLKWLVEYVGFVDVKRTLYASGEVEDLEVIEPMEPLKIMESLCIECKKPVA